MSDLNLPHSSLANRARRQYNTTFVALLISCAVSQALDLQRRALPRSSVTPHSLKTLLRRQQAVFHENGRAPAAGGDVVSAPFFGVVFEKPSTYLTAICTQCSVPQYIGAVVGRRCWTASGKLGNCNVFGTGGTSCESVGPDCEAASECLDD